MSAKIDTAAIEALSETEQHVLSVLQQWGELFISTNVGTERMRTGKKSSDAAKVNLNEAAVGLIDKIMTTLVELRGRLQEAGR